MRENEEILRFLWLIRYPVSAEFSFSQRGRGLDGMHTPFYGKVNHFDSKVGSSILFFSRFTQWHCTSVLNFASDGDKLKHFRFIILVALIEIG